ncbi:MAG: DUF350 domain-containing protein [Spirochaetota bacterium]
MELVIDWNLLILGIVELLLTLILSVFMVFIGYRAFSLFTKEFKEEDELKNNNVAVGILSGAVIFAMALLLKTAVDPSITTLRLLAKDGLGATDILLTLAFFIMFFVLACAIALFIVLLSSLLYQKLTKSIKEFTEIKNNNIAVAIVLAVVIISIAFLVQEGVAGIISGIQPWPEPIKNEDVPTKIGLYIENSFEYIRLIL